MKLEFSKTAIGKLRMTGIIEGVSFLVLLFIAMPMKYFAGMPEAVKYTGWIHGVLFIAYITALVNVWFSLRWSFGKVFIAFFASLIPFGTFLLDPRLRKEEKMILAKLEPKD